MLSCVDFIFNSRPRFRNTISSRLANRKPRKLSPFENMAKMMEIHPDTLSTITVKLLGVTYGTPEGPFLFQYLPEKKLKYKELERKSKPEYLVLTTYHLSFPILSRIEIKPRKLEWISKQQIFRFNNLSSSFSNHPPYFSGDYSSQWLARIILFC